MASNIDLLTHFGGTANSSLTNIIKNNKHNGNIELGDHELDCFTQSDYVNHDKLISYLEKHISRFSILSLNVQSLNAKIDQLKILIYELSQHNLYFNIICVQETWLSQNSDLDLIQLENYNFISKGKK